MKSPILFVIILLSAGLFIFQCGNKNPADPDDGIFGLWAWERSTGGIAGETIYADSVDYNRSLSIDENFTYMILG